jgi:ABC-2 type transport system ATP-binding protein
MIEIKNLNFRYGKQLNLFEGLTLSESSGSIVGLLGKNGAGKSTLLKIITGLLEAPKHAVLVMDETPFQRKPSLLEEIYFIPEEYELPGVKLATYVKANAPYYPRFDAKKLEEILAAFELDQNSRLSKLSYGQRKKFLIAFALSTNCKLLVLDEPTNGLDIPSKAVFRKVVASSLSEDQLVFISTHQVKDVENLIDKIIVLDNGKIIFHQSMWEISEKYAFTTTTTPEGTNCLYHEVAPGGYKVMKPKNGVPTEVDIELLFNAVINRIAL